MTDKRVLLLATNFFGVGGVERYTRMLADAFGDILGPSAVDVFSLMGNRLGRDGDLPYCYLGSAGEFGNLPAKLRFVFRCLFLAYAKKYDLVVACHISLAPIAYVIKRLVGSKYFAVAYGVEVWGKLEPLKYRALRSADRVLAISKFTAQMLIMRQKLDAVRLQIIRPAVDRTWKRRNINPGICPRTNGRSILTVARLSSIERHKGCDSVISALHQLKDTSTSDVMYTIVGDGDDRARLETLAAELGIEKKVVFAGHVDDETLRVHYRSCCLFVMASKYEKRDHGWMGEGFGIACIEAAAFGKAVITSNVGGSREAVVDGVTGFAVDPNDVIGLASAIRQLMGNEALRATMGLAGKKWVRKTFTYERFRRQVKEVLLREGYARSIGSSG